MIIGMILSLLVIVYLTKMKTAVQFCLSCLSMVESKFVRENPQIMALFGGDFTSVDVNYDAMSGALKKAEEEMDESVIIIGENKEIVSFNARAVSCFRFDQQIVQGMPLSKILIIDKNIYSITSNTIIDAEVRIVNINQTVSMQIRVIPVEFQNSRFILMFNDSHEVILKKEEILKLEEMINALKFRAMPEILKDKVNQRMEMDVFNMAVCVMQICGHDKLMAGLRPEEIRSRLEKCSGIASVETDKIRDGLKFRTLGLSAFIYINMKEGKLTIQDVIHDLVTLCRNCRRQFLELGADVRAGACYEQWAKAGMVNEHRVLFDVYTPAVDISYAMARRASAGELVLCPKLLSVLPNRATTPSKPIEIEWNESVREGFAIPIVT